MNAISINESSVSELNVKLKDTHPDTVEEVLRVLRKMDPLSKRGPSQSKLERLERFISDRYLPYLITLLLAFLGVVVCKKTMFNEVHYIDPVGFYMYLFIMIFSLVFLIAVPILGAATLLDFKNVAYQRASLERQHDLFHVAELHRYSSVTLKLAEDMLKIEQDRITRRIAAFVGGGDKLALLAIAGLAWGAYQTLNQSGKAIYDSIFSYPSAFLAGGVIGALLLQRVSARTSYHLDLLKLADLYQDQRGRLDCFYDVHLKLNLKRRFVRYVSWMVSLREDF